MRIKKIKDREFDVLFCLRYLMNNNHYSSRKRYNFIIQLSNILAKSNFKVCIMGDGWNQVRSIFLKKFFYLILLIKIMDRFIGIVRYIAILH